MSKLCDHCIDYLDWSCNDCGKNTMKDDYYMVIDKIWKKFAKDLNGPDDLLCLACLEKRVGRRLTIKDFTKCLINIQSGSAMWRYLSRQRGLA